MTDQDKKKLDNSVYDMGAKKIYNWAQKTKLVISNNGSRIG